MGNRQRHPAKPQSLVDIIIPVFNRSDLLKRCLEYIPKACDKNSFSVYVFDNGSTMMGESRNIQDYCQASGATYMRNGSNLGFPMACNRAANRGTSPLLFFLNDDVFLLENSVDELVKAMDDPTIGVAGMRLLYPLDSTDPSRPAGKIQHVGISTNIRGDLFHQFVGWTPENPRTLKIRYPLAVTGAALMTRRKIFKDAHGFFEGYGIGTYEDVDYCMVVRSMGYNVYVAHEAVGFHLTGATAQSQQIAYPLNNNRDILRLRWKEKIPYTEWENW